MRNALAEENDTVTKSYDCCIHAKLMGAMIGLGNITKPHLLGVEGHRGNDCIGNHN